MTATLSVLVAETKPDDSLVSPGLAGFLVTFALAVATVFLIRSMTKHLRKVRYGPGPEGAAGTPDGTSDPETGEDPSGPRQAPPATPSGPAR